MTSPDSAYVTLKQLWADHDALVALLEFATGEARAEAERLLLDIRAKITDLEASFRLSS